MTQSRSLPILLLALCSLSMGIALSANALATDKAGIAASHFERGDYGEAYKQYLKLAKDGDTFAQYQVSYMKLMGLGADADTIEAMAWAVLAAESGNEGLVRYQDAVAALVPVDERKKAQSKTDYYLRRWGRDDRGGTSARAPDKPCTGSRLGGNCGESGSSAGKWIAWEDDRSDDPEHRRQMEALNRSIQENATQIRIAAGDS
jgi:hypothetical protein